MGRLWRGWTSTVNNRKSNQLIIKIDLCAHRRCHIMTEKDGKWRAFLFQCGLSRTFRLQWQRSNGEWAMKLFLCCFCNWEKFASSCSNSIHHLQFKVQVNPYILDSIPSSWLCISAFIILGFHTAILYWSRRWCADEESHWLHSILLKYAMLQPCLMLCPDHIGESFLLHTFPSLPTYDLNLNRKSVNRLALYLCKCCMCKWESEAIALR